MARRTVFETPVVSTFICGLAWLFLKAIRWRASGTLPESGKCVVIAAPHTSNWDAVLCVAFGAFYRVNMRFMAKAGAFRFPFGPLVRWLGGIPIDRSKAHGVVAQTIDAINAADNIVVCIPPEGTRKKGKAWKTGFYRVAHGANVPIVMGFLDYKERCGGFGPNFMPSGDIEADMEILRAFYSTITGKYPEKFTQPSVAVASAETEPEKKNGGKSA